MRRLREKLRIARFRRRQLRKNFAKLAKFNEAGIRIFLEMAFRPMRQEAQGSSHFCFAIISTGNPFTAGAGVAWQRCEARSEDNSTVDMSEIPLLVPHTEYDDSDCPGLLVCVLPRTSVKDGHTYDGHMFER